MCGGSWSFRTCGGLPRGIAAWQPPASSTQLFGKPELAAGGNCSGLDKLQLAWPEAALPRCAAGHGRSVLAAACLAVSLLGDRRPLRRNLAAWHTRAKGYSAQAVKPDVCRCAEIEKETHLVDHRQHYHSSVVCCSSFANAGCGLARLTQSPAEAEKPRATRTLWT